MGRILSLKKAWCDKDCYPGGFINICYFNKDDETYPVYFEDMLNGAGIDRRLEVIDLGIPHLRSENILALFLACWIV